MSRQIHLSAFLLTGPVIHSHAVWRHPKPSVITLDPEYYARVAKVVEEGLFDFLFFADRLAVGDQMGGSGTWPCAMVPRMPPAWTRCRSSPIWSARPANWAWGRPVPRPTTNRPISPGNSPPSITCPGAVPPGTLSPSMNDSEGRLFGKDRHLEHDLRYDRADEFVEVALKLWRSWGPDALKLDRESGVLADPSRIHSVQHHGEWFKVEGPLNIPRTPPRAARY